MIRRLTATRFQRRITNGKTRPILLACEAPGGPDGIEQDVVVKLDHAMEIKGAGLVAEAMASMVARDLGLRVPTPFFVELDSEFIDSIVDDAVASDLRNCCPVTFGSRLMNGFWVVTRDFQIGNGLIEKAGDIFAFDVLSNNADRRVENPNCMTDGADLLVLDHELAFYFGILFYKHPWIEGSLEHWRTGVPHLFYSALKGRGLSMGGLIARLAAITPERCNQYIGALPNEWNAHREKAEEIVGFVRQLVENREAAFNEVRRILQ